MSITNATNLRKNLFSFLESAINDETILVTTAKGNAAIISEEYLRNLEETCFLYSIPGMKESIEEGINTPREELVELDWRKALK